MSLKDITEQMADLEATAGIDLESVDQRTRSGTGGLIRQAKDQLQVLRSKYLTEIMNYSFIIAVNGPGSEAFAKIAEDKFGTVSVDYKKLPKMITERLQNRRCREIYTQNEHWMLLTELNQIKLEYEVARMISPQFTANSPYYEKPLYEAVDTLLNETYGKTLDSAVIRREIGNAAYTKRFSGAKLPVVVYNFDGDTETGFDSTVLPRPVKLLTVKSNVTEASVKKDLEAVRDQLAGKKPAPKRVVKKKETGDNLNPVTTFQVDTSTLEPVTDAEIESSLTTNDGEANNE